jgi:hypothetical protein
MTAAARPGCHYHESHGPALGMHGERSMAKKSTCPITRKQFREKAQRVEVTINGQKWMAAPKEFSTNSLGWNLNEKITIEIDGVSVTVQVGLNLTVVGSKELPLDAPAHGGAADGH